MINTKVAFSWKKLSWKKFREKIYLLQAQIFNCLKYKRFKKALLYQEFLLNSVEISYVAIKHITQLRLDRKISGFDNQLITTSLQRTDLFLKIKKNFYRWNCKKRKLVYLVDFLKGNNLISVPTIYDRVIQYIWGLILEPIFNSLFFNNQVSLSTINNFLFAKYTVILSLITRLQSENYSFIHFKCKISSSVVPKFAIKHFLKILFFPESYKKVLSTFFKSSMLLNTQSRNENLHFYLNSFHYFLILFGMWSLKHIFLKKLKLKGLPFSNQLVFSLYYFNDLLFFLKQDQNQKFYLNLIKKLISENCILSTIFIITNLNSSLAIEFLDWQFIVLHKYNCQVLPCKTTWLEEKIQFKRILRSKNFNIYQRIKIAEIFIRTRFFTNWFCSFIVMKKQLNILKFNLNKKMANWLKSEKYSISRKSGNFF